MSKIGVSGFTIVRNAIQLNYPFQESVLSLLPLCDEVIIACGDSRDGTEALCENLAERYPTIKLIKSKWTEANQSGGFQLRSQTDLAMSHCRNPWCFYLQADEVLHEQDEPLIREAIRRADQRADIDGIAFDYLHFYGSYAYQIRGRNWYRREVRLFKNNRGITAFRDAQGFRKEGKRLSALHSPARVFHYGYVRSSDSLLKKSGEMSKWWGEKPSADPSHFQLKRHVGLSRFTQSHPQVMSERIARDPGDFNPALCPRAWDGNELKNALTLLWDRIFPFRIGEFRNFDLKSL